jgi:hypothetical protein
VPLLASRANRHSSRPRAERTAPTGLISNSLEFEGIKTWVVDAFPDAEEQDRVFIFEPLLDQCASSIEVAHPVGERNVISTRLRENADGCSLNLNCASFDFAHGALCGWLD